MCPRLRVHLPLYLLLNPIIAHRTGGVDRLPYLIGAEDTEITNGVGPDSGEAVRLQL